jgi:hypothetical protein
MAVRFIHHLLEGDHASRPAASAVPEGTLYACSDHVKIYQSDTSSWSDWHNPTTGTLTDHTHAATGSGATGGGATLNPVTMKLPAAMGTTEGQVDWDTTLKKLEVYDGQRELGIGHGGWAPHALPTVFVADAAFTTSETLPISGGSIAVPIHVPAQLLSRGFTIHNRDTTNTRAIEARLYQQRLNNGNGGENTLDFVTGTDATDSFTAAAASTRAVVFSGAPVYLAPGIYWLVVRNTSGTQTWALGSTASSSAFSMNTGQTKTLGSSLGSTLDFVAATWVKVTAIYAVRLVGNVFGQTSSF